ncbi:hypothetical protein AMTR_s00109p00108480 [Amborella trichopoda]|uniref:Uncharacterized protein n=1 Tax=Amborella trichopoda TaxID=13333 RepID=W1NSJ1_AMBTC|nr:hypothetical protein AMTR_s00109p00108480 [Amborella trichopoda]
MGGSAICAAVILVEPLIETVTLEGMERHPGRLPPQLLHCFTLSFPEEVGKEEGDGQYEDSENGDYDNFNFFLIESDISGAIFGKHLINYHLDGVGDLSPVIFRRT